jgi:hypothetical protein
VGVLVLAFCAQLQAQPTILQQPIALLDQLLGSSVSLCVTAQSAASTNLQYQWLRNGVIIPDATNSCLPINSLQAADCGAFSVLVSDGVGVAVSERADVTVSINILQGIDNIIDALDLLQTNGVIRSYNTGAVKQPGTPDIIPGDPGGSEIWFKWTVPLLQSSGIVTFDTLGSDFDTTMGVYTGSEPTSLTPVPTAINDDDAAGYLNSQVTFYAVSGTTYLIAVDGFYGAQGNVVLNWTLYPNSPTLPSAVPTPQAITASNGATVTLNSPWPGHNCDWLFNGVVAATNTSVLTISNLDQTTVGSYVARYSVTASTAVSAEPTQVQINTLQDGSTSTNSVAWIKYLDSANSVFVQPATEKTEVQKLDGGGDSGGFSCSQTFSTTGNSDEPGEPVVCDQNGGHPGWYAYVAPTSGSLIIETEGSTFNSILGVFIGPGTSFSTLTNIGCGYTTNYHLGGQPSVFIPNVPAGQTNYIVVEGENDASGVVQLNIHFGNPVSILSPPQSQSAGPGTNVTLAVSASGSTPMSYAWQFDGASIPGATTGTLSISNMQPSSAGTYSVIISNSFSVVTTQAVVTYVAAPAITTQPASQTVASNSTANLSVSATGSPAPVYQWFMNGAPAGSNSSAFCIPTFQSTDQGTYTVIISNALGAVTSAPALLLLDGPTRVNSYGMSNGAFSLQLAGPAGTSYIIEASSDLLNWVPIVTNSTSSGILDFTDTNAGTETHRFYRGTTNSP